MLLLQDAWVRAQELLDAVVRPGNTVEIVIAAVEQHDKAWIFGYNTRPFLADDDFLSGLVGNGPVVVPKDGSSPFLAGSAEPVMKQLDRLYSDRA